MRVIKTATKPKISFNRKLPQSITENSLSDLFILKLTDKIPNKKMTVEMIIPIRIDVKTIGEISEKLYSKEIIKIDRAGIPTAMMIRRFSFIIISGFQNRFNKSIQSGKYSKE